MNGMRRFFLAFYSILLIAAAGGLIGLVWNDNQKLDLTIGDFNLVAFVTASDSAQVGATVICSGIAAIGLLTLILAFLKSSEAGKGTIRMRQADGGTVEVTTTAVEQLLREEIEALPEVRQVSPKVRLSGNAVDSSMTVVIDPGENIAHVTNVVSDATQRALKDQVGVTNVKRPHIRISYEQIKGLPPVAPRGPRPMYAAEGPPVSPPPPTGGQVPNDGWPSRQPVATAVPETPLQEAAPDEAPPVIGEATEPAAPERPQDD